MAQRKVKRKFKYIRKIVDYYGRGIHKYFYKTKRRKLARARARKRTVVVGVRG